MQPSAQGKQNMGGSSGLEREDLSHEDNDRILLERAERLALKDVSTIENKHVHLAVEFLLSNQRYALRLESLREVHPLRDVTVIPCVPPHIVGVINLRGQVLTVLDLRPILGLKVDGPIIFNKAVIAEDNRLSVAFLADEVIGTRGVEVSMINENTHGLPGMISTYADGVTADGAILLNAKKIISDDRLRVR
jgi:purine-binding chemotaxis protein CheW